MESLKGRDLSKCRIYFIQSMVLFLSAVLLIYLNMLSHFLVDANII